LFTRNGKGLTARGIKPICNFQQVFKYTYLFGAYSPFTGSHFELELPFCNSSTFQLYLEEFSLCNPDEFKIIVLDNGAFHKAKKIQIPQNIALVFLPPYSPELNPAEKIWWTIKRAYTSKLFQTLDDISVFIDYEINRLTTDNVISICAYEYIYSCNYWTNIK